MNSLHRYRRLAQAEHELPHSIIDAVHDSGVRAEPIGDSSWGAGLDAVPIVLDRRLRGDLTRCWNAIYLVAMYAAGGEAEHEQPQ